MPSERCADTKKRSFPFKDNLAGDGRGKLRFLLGDHAPSTRRIDIDTQNAKLPAELAALVGTSFRAQTGYGSDITVNLHLNIRATDEIVGIRRVLNIANLFCFVDDFAVPGDPGYGFDDYGPGKRLDLEYLRQGKLRDLIVFFPSVPSHEETGAKRGCVIATANGEIAKILEHCIMLRRWSN